MHTKILKLELTLVLLETYIYGFKHVLDQKTGQYKLYLCLVNSSGSRGRGGLGGLNKQCLICLRLQK